MKKISLVLAGLVVFAACQKKTKMTNCYYCVSNDSISSNIPALVFPHYKGEKGYHCEINEAQKDFMVKTGNYVDTYFFRNDTLMLNHWTTSCDFTE